MQGVEAGWLQDSGLESVCVEGLGSVARSREVEGLTVVRVGLVTGWMELLVVCTGSLALVVGLIVVRVDTLAL